MCMQLQVGRILGCHVAPQTTLCTVLGMVHAGTGMPNWDGMAWMACFRELGSPAGGSGVIPTRPFCQALSPLVAHTGPVISRAQTWSDSRWSDPSSAMNRLATPFANPIQQQTFHRLPSGLTPSNASMYGLTEGSPTKQRQVMLLLPLHRHSSACDCLYCYQDLLDLAP